MASALAVVRAADLGIKRLVETPVRYGSLREIRLSYVALGNTQDVSRPFWSDGQKGTVRGARIPSERNGGVPVGVEQVESGHTGVSAARRLMNYEPKPSSALGYCYGHLRSGSSSAVAARDPLP